MPRTYGIAPPSAGQAGDAFAQTHESDSTAHSAAEITFQPAGNVAATNVQAAIEEVAAEGGGAGVSSFNGRTGAPTDNTVGWYVGDKVIATAPAAGGSIGWVCTAAGTPGTWKTFGAISA